MPEGTNMTLNNTVADIKSTIRDYRMAGNSQGGYFFLILTSGGCIDRPSWTGLPMIVDVIERVHVIARHRKSSSSLTFGWSNGSRIVYDDKDKYHDDRM